MINDVALSGNTVRNVALGLWLVGHPCNSKTHRLTSKPRWGMCNPGNKWSLCEHLIWLASEFSFVS